VWNKARERTSTTFRNILQQHNVLCACLSNHSADFVSGTHHSHRGKVFLFPLDNSHFLLHNFFRFQIWICRNENYLKSNVALNCCDIMSNSHFRFRSLGFSLIHLASPLLPLSSSKGTDIHSQKRFHDVFMKTDKIFLHTFCYFQYHFFPKTDVLSARIPQHFFKHIMTFLVVHVSLWYVHIQNKTNTSHGLISCHIIPL
jgi:hypothetical protein